MIVLLGAVCSVFLGAIGSRGLFHVNVFFGFGEDEVCGVMFRDVSNDREELVLSVRVSFLWVRLQC